MAFPTMSEPHSGRDPIPHESPREGGLQPTFLRRLIRWLRARLHSLYAAGGVLLVSGLLLAVVCLLTLSELSEEVLSGETLGFDEAVLLRVAEYATPRLDGYALQITALGGWIVVLAIMVIVAAVLLLLGERWYSVMLAASVLGGWMIGPLLKGLFARDRPDVVDWRVPHAGMASFPSGHSIMGMVLFATLAYIVHRLGQRWWVSVLAIATAAAVVAMIGATRVYLGVHYPSDVLAGYLVGFAWAMFCAAAVELLRAERPDP